jgi:hypothetical protein
MPTDVIETVAIPDTFALDLAKTEKAGPCTRLTFTVDAEAYSGGRDRVVVCKLVVPTESLRAIASAIMAAEIGQPIAEPAPAGASHH